MRCLHTPLPHYFAFALALAPLIVDEALAQNKDAATQHHAEYQRISTSEASRRMQMERDAGKLSARMQREQPGTFAGLYIQHDPEFRVVVRFAGNAVKQLAAYTVDPAYVAETAPFSLEMLRATQEEIGVLLTEAKIEYASEVDVKTSSLIVYVRDPDVAGEVLSNILAAVDFVTIKETPGFIQTTTVSGGGVLEGDSQLPQRCG